MSNNEEKKRPNANYQLSRDIPTPEGIVYHYNRERRLAKAPQSVRELYEPNPPRRFGVFRTLTDTKPKALMFASIVVICAAILVMSSLGLLDDSLNLEGNNLSIRAFNHEGIIVVAITKTIQKNILSYFNTPYTGEITIAVLPAENAESERIISQKIYFTLEQEEVYRLFIPFDADELLLVFHTEKSRLSAKVKVMPQ